MRTFAPRLVLCSALIATPTMAQEDASCATSPAAVEQAGGEEAPELQRDGNLTAADEERVVDYLLERVLENGATAFGQQEIHDATGVVVLTEDAPLLQSELFLRLEELGIDPLAGSRCSDYGACSLYGDLSGASGEILAMYEREKKEDGKGYRGTELPELTAQRLSGEEVRASDLVGRETVIVLLAVHCRHSLDSVPILDRLVDQYGDRGLQVVGIYVNSGSHEDVAAWLPELGPKFDVWVSDGDGLGDVLESHLVPAYLFVDREGRITKKLVGYKEESEVLAEVAQRLAEPAGGR